MRDKIKSAIEAILFACGEPVDISRISDVLQLNEQDVREAISQLQTEYNGKKGIGILILENSVQMTSDPEFAPEIRAILDLRKSLPLSQASLEVLSVVAYNEPVTKAFIEGVRGVDCTAVLSSLMTKNLIEERGRLELPGRPLLYGTTPAFLRCMNITSLDDLPPVKSGENENGDIVSSENSDQSPEQAETDDVL